MEAVAARSPHPLYLGEVMPQLHWIYQCLPQWSHDGDYGGWSWDRHTSTGALRGLLWHGLTTSHSQICTIIWTAACRMAVSSPHHLCDGAGRSREQGWLLYSQGPLTRLVRKADGLFWSEKSGLHQGSFSHCPAVRMNVLKFSLNSLYLIQFQLLPIKWLIQ